MFYILDYQEMSCASATDPVKLNFSPSVPNTFVGSLLPTYISLRFENEPNVLVRVKLVVIRPSALISVSTVEYGAKKPLTVTFSVSEPCEIIPKSSVSPVDASYVLVE